MSGTVDKMRRGRERANDGLREIPRPSPLMLSLPAGDSLYILKFTGTRTGKRYTGTAYSSGGTAIAGTAQFRFPNDPGVDTLLDANDYVLGIKCPSFDTANAAWSGTNEKYWVFLSPWGALG